MVLIGMTRRVSSIRLRSGEDEARPAPVVVRWKRFFRGKSRLSRNSPGLRSAGRPLGFHVPM